MTENKRLFVGRKTVEDRFTIITDYDGEIGVKENRSGDVLVLKHSDLNAQQFVAQLVLFLNDQNQAIVDLYDGSKYWSDKATEKIKALEKENEQLKQAYQKLEHRHSLLHDECLDAECERDGLKKDVESLEEENEYLKTKVDFYKDFQKDARELDKENEELKSELKIYREVANCGNCHYHNYDWFDDGDEFEVCDKGNDMWYGICQDWSEL